MAINQAFNAGTLAILEQPAEPGQPIQFWSGSKWDTVATQIPLAPHPVPGVSLFDLPTSITAAFPDKIYRLHVLDPGGPFKNDVVEIRSFALWNGDDGGNGLPSINIPLSGVTIGGVSATGTLKLYGAALVQNTPPG